MAWTGMRGIAPVPGYVVMQASTLCNLACTYCYLPDRAYHRPMPVAVAGAVAESVNPWAAAEPGFAVVWHGGEPLAAGRPALAELMDVFVGVEHQVQTNATLITDPWCELLAERKARVSISVDGPEALNGHRIVRGMSRPAYPRIMKGVAALRRNGIPFSALCVVSEPRPGLAADLYGYFLDLGCDALGISVEEQEGVNARANDEGDDAVVTFWSELVAAWSQYPSIRVREIDHAMGYLDAVADNTTDRVLPRAIDPEPMIMPDGQVVPLSPGSRGSADDTYGDFTVGNVLESPLRDLLVDLEGRVPWAAEFVRGVEACRDSCRYFGFCGGAQAGNRYFEHGRFDGTVTNHCRNSKIRLLDGMLERADVGGVAGLLAQTSAARAAHVGARTSGVTDTSAATFYNWNNRPR
jgi:uncharacterized protein